MWNPGEAGHYSSSLTLWLSPPGSFSLCVKAVHDTVRWQLLFGSEFCNSLRESCQSSERVTHGLTTATVGRYLDMRFRTSIHSLQYYLRKPNDIFEDKKLPTCSTFCLLKPPLNKPKTLKFLMVHCTALPDTTGQRKCCDIQDLKKN